LSLFTYTIVRVVFHISSLSEPPQITAINIPEQNIRDGRKHPVCEIIYEDSIVAETREIHTQIEKILPTPINPVIQKRVHIERMFK